MIFNRNVKLLTYLFCSVGLFNSTNIIGQTQESDTTKQLVLEIGDTLTFKTNCNNGTFRFIDLYTKTRYTDSILNFNYFTGEGFHNAFFGSGDFDAKRLPCSYNGQKFTIISTQNFADKNTGEQRFIVFVMLEDWRKVAWIEFIEAYEAGEIVLN
mgnify:CR=1 FL=1